MPNRSNLGGRIELELGFHWRDKPELVDGLVHAVEQGLQWPTELYMYQSDFKARAWRPQTSVREHLMNPEAFYLKGRLGVLEFFRAYSLQDSGFALRIAHIYDTCLDAPDWDLRDRLRAFVVLAGSLPGVKWVGPEAYVDVMSFTYSRPRPPHYNSRFQPGAVWVCSDRRYHHGTGYGHGFADPEAHERFRTKELPAGATRYEEGDLVIVDFGGDLANPDDMRRTATQQHQWIGPDIAKGIDNNFNRLGDRLEIVSGHSNDPDLTFYARSPDPKHPELTRAFKAVVPDADGALPDADLAKYRAMIQARETLAGNHLPRLFFIAPTRELALALLPHVRAIGAETVVYPFNTPNGAIVYYDVAPKGLWLN